MKFIRYCYLIDIDIHNSRTRNFGNNVIWGYVIDNHIYLTAKEFPHFLCEFVNDDDMDLTDEQLLKWGANTVSFIKETIGFINNPNLIARNQYILRNIKAHQNEVLYDSNDPFMCIIDSKPVVELKESIGSYFLTIDQKPLFEKGISNMNVAIDLFNKIVKDLGIYVKIRWSKIKL